MRRGISNKYALLTSLAIRHQDKAIEHAGGFAAPEQPNRELRRRMEREARQEAKHAAHERKNHG